MPVSVLDTDATEPMTTEDRLEEEESHPVVNGILALFAVACVFMAGVILGPPITAYFAQASPASEQAVSAAIEKGYFVEVGKGTHDVKIVVSMPPKYLSCDASGHPQWTPAANDRMAADGYEGAVLMEGEFSHTSVETRCGPRLSMRIEPWDALNTQPGSLFR
jgi:hypothetical protein